MRKKIAIVIGTRPEATKVCVLFEKLKKRSEEFEVKLILTGQHKEQIDQVMSVYGLHSDWNLDIMKEKQSLAYVTSTLVSKLDDVYKEIEPDIVLVHGDTQSSFCGALVAFLNKIPVGHIESGLRSYNRKSPWPEEVNRLMTDALSDLHFAPTENNKKALINQGYDSKNIFVTGQTAVDATLGVVEKVNSFTNQFLSDLVEGWSGRIITMTVHRRENYGIPMENIFRAIRRVIDENEDTILVYPVHLSPEVRKYAYKELDGHKRIHLIEPINYFDMIYLMSKSYVVFSDSGGLQEETTSMGIPMLLLRDTTERQEAIEAGSVILTGTDEDSIYTYAMDVLINPHKHEDMSNANNPFGDGRASDRIVEILLERLFSDSANE